MFIIGEAVIDDSVGKEAFACELEVCKGACCTIEGGRGAPLDDMETEQVKLAFPQVREYLREISLKVIEEVGIVEGTPGDYATPCVGHRECVYVYFERGIARCAFERAYFEGKTRWRKPLSCHLFPLRIRHFGQEFIGYETIEECEGGRTRGKADGIRLRDFIKEALVRKYGIQWYEAFLRECKTRDTEPKTP
jgi:hypothetical protein